MIIYLNNKNYRQEISKFNFPGCYVGFDKYDKAVYAGQSKNMAARTMYHPVLRPENCEYIKFFGVVNKKTRLLTESRFIKWYNPPYNKYLNPEAFHHKGQLRIT